MTKRETVLKAIQHSHRDPVPYHADFTRMELEKMVRYTGNPDFRNSFGDYISSIAVTDFRSRIGEAPGFEHDEFGVSWNTGDEDIGVVCRYPLRDASLSGYGFPGPDTEGIAAQMRKLIENGQDTFKIVNVGFTLYERAWSLRGIEDLLMDMMYEERFVSELMDRITEYNLTVMRTALAFDGFDAFHFGDDWGQQHGLIMGKPLWKKYIQPAMQEVFSFAKQNSKAVFFHSCGDIAELLPDLIDMGMDVYETFQPEVYDIQKIKNEFGRSITFLGGISTQRLLPFASPQEVRDSIRRTKEIMASGGGYIVAPTHAVPGDVPEENVLAMLEAFQES